jgi:peptidoglycan/LPS O-acetylase OafA/YrhL
MADIRPTFHVAIWLGNLCFLQGLYVPVFGSDGALWSLANEFWYYLAFPMVLLAFRRGTPFPLRCVYIAAIAAIFYFPPSGLFFMFFAWLMGTILALLPPPRLGAAWRIAATAIYLPIFFFIAKRHTENGIAEDLLLSVLTMFFFYVLLSARAPARESRFFTRLWRLLARFSYSLYIVHMPLLILLGALTLGGERWRPDALHVPMALLLLSVPLGYAYLIASVTEFRTDQLRKVIERRLSI